MYFPVDTPPVQKTVPLIRAFTLTLPNNQIEFSPEFIERQDLLLTGITCRFNWDPVNAGNQIYIEFNGYGQRKWNSDPINLMAISGPGGTEPGFKFYTPPLAIQFPYDRDSAFIGKITGLTGSDPDTLNLALWFRKSWGVSPYG